jgi:hypothetical protein
LPLYPAFIAPYLRRILLQMSESTLKKVVADVENLKSQLEDSKGYMKTSKACDECASRSTAPRCRCALHSAV